MNNELLIEIYEQAGLVHTGYNEDEEPVFIGTKAQWDSADRLIQAQLLPDQEQKNGK